MALLKQNWIHFLVHKQEKNQQPFLQAQLPAHCLLSSYPGHAFRRYFETVCVFSFMLLAVVKLLPQGEDFYSVTKEKQTTPVFSFRAHHFYNLISSDCTAIVTGHRPYLWALSFNLKHGSDVCGGIAQNGAPQHRVCLHVIMWRLKMGWRFGLRSSNMGRINK